MNTPLTHGAHHIGLSVPDLARAQSFFCDILGYSLVAEKPDYPAAFVSDGTTLLTLWQVADPEAATPFDRRANIGLHHLALKVADMESLTALYEKLSMTDEVVMEFAPEPISAGASTYHFVCAMPGGIRIEFATPF